MSVELYPHQIKALEKMHDGCVLTGGVGTGKTMVSLSYYLKHHSGKKLYILTTARKRDEGDWQREAGLDRKSTRLNSSHSHASRMPSSA